MAAGDTFVRTGPSRNMSAEKLAKTTSATQSWVTMAAIAPAARMTPAIRYQVRVENTVGSAPS